MPYIDHDLVDRIKREVNLPKLIEDTGVILREHSNGTYQGLCPLHNDKNPSLSVTKKNGKWLWHCFGCRKKGTAIDWMIELKGMSFKEAYEYLLDYMGITETKTERIPPKNQKENQSQRNYKLLKQVFTHYEKTFKENKEAQEYLKQRGITTPAIYENIRIGYADGSLPKQREVIETLKEMSILGKQGGETFYKCVVLPIEDVQGELKGIYGRRITNKDHRYLTGKHEGVFNARAFRASRKIYITECIIDALSLQEIGIKEAVSLFGAGGLTEDQMKYMKETQTEEVILCLDNDEAGRKSTEKISKKLINELGVKCYKLDLPEEVKDLNEWLLAGMTKETVLKNTKRIVYMEDPSKGYDFKESERDYYFNFTDREYRVRGLELEKIGRFKANIRIKTGESSHLDTFDITSSTPRERFIRMVKKLMGLNEGKIREDIRNIIEKLEEVQTEYLRAKKKNKAEKKEMTEEEKEEAMEILENENLLERIISDYHRCGYVGEDRNLLIGYLAATSRKLRNPLSLAIISRSAAGKTSLQDAVLSFIPEEEVIKYTRLTGQSLFYHEKEALYKKVLAIEEEAGALETDYGLRNVLTSECLRTGSTIKDPQSGELRNQTAEVKISTSVFMTTTKQTLNYETMNRFIIATIDESEEQTERILEYQRKLYGEDGYGLRKRKEGITRLHKNIQRLIKQVDIVNPFENRLTFTSKTLRARRENIKYLNLINAVALVRQYQREIRTREDGAEYITVDIGDVRIANDLAREYLTKNLDCLSPPAKSLYENIRELILNINDKTGMDLESIQISRRQIMDYTGWSEWQVRAHIKELVELEYLQQVQGKQGKRYCYKLIEDIDYELPKIDIEINLPEIIEEPLGFARDKEIAEIYEKTQKQSKIAQKLTKLRDFVKLRD
jgi:DNA primase catalytic core